MGNKALENRINQLKELERQQALLEEQAKKLREEIKTDMQAKGEDELYTGNFIIRLKEVITNRFDSKSFAKEHKALYEAYTKPQSSIRFTIA